MKSLITKRHKLFFAFGHWLRFHLWHTIMSNDDSFHRWLISRWRKMSHQSIYHFNGMVYDVMMTSYFQFSFKTFNFRRIRIWTPVQYPVQLPVQSFFTKQFTLHIQLWVIWWLILVTHCGRFFISVLLPFQNTETKYSPNSKAPPLKLDSL